MVLISGEALDIIVIPGLFDIDSARLTLYKGESLRREAVVTAADENLRGGNAGCACGHGDHNRCTKCFRELHLNCLSCLLVIPRPYGAGALLRRHFLQEGIRAG